MGYQPVGFTTNSSDYNPRDDDRPSREPVYDPLKDAFGDTFYSPPNWQLDDVFDETGGKKIFWRCYATKPCRTLVDVYKVKPSSGWYVDEDTSKAIAAMRAIALTKAEKIAIQLEAHNAAHPTERYGLIQIIGDDVVDKADVANAAEGKIVGPCTPGPQDNPQGEEEKPPNSSLPLDGISEGARGRIDGQES